MRSKFIIVYILFSVLVITYLVWLNYTKKPKVVERTVTQYVEVEKPRYVEKVKRVIVPVEKVVTLEREKVVEKENLPDWLKNATEQVILAVGDVRPYAGKTRVISLLNTKTGEGSLIQRQLPLSFVELKRDLRLSAGWDFIAHQPIGNIEFTFLRISRVNLKVEGGFLGRPYGGVEVCVEF